MGNGFDENWYLSHRAKMARANSLAIARAADDRDEPRLVAPAPTPSRKRAATRISPEMRVKLLAPRRPVADEVVLAFDLPPSANKAWRGIEGGKGRVRSDEYKDWVERCCVLLSDARISRVEGVFSAVIEARRPESRGGTRRDIDNIIKPTLDLLHHTGMTADDCKCMEVTARWVAKRNASGIVVVLRTWRAA